MQIKNNKKAEFWITNISTNYDIALADLRITVRKGTSINLLNNHYNYTIDQIKKSVESGSIFKKSRFIKIRDYPPVVFSYRLDYVFKREGLKKIRKKNNNEQAQSYEELDFDDDNISREDLLAQQEEIAREQADMDFIDKAPILPVDPKFKEQ